jgi:hypothetical protein
MATLRRALAGVAPPFGADAVRGNVEQDDWEQIFAGTGVRSFERTTALTAGPIDLVALSFADGFTAERVAMPGDRFKVAFGHSPFGSLMVELSRLLPPTGGLARSISAVSPRIMSPSNIARPSTFSKTTRWPR